MKYCTQLKKDLFLNWWSVYWTFGALFISGPLGLLIGILIGGPMFMVAGWGWAVLAAIIIYIFIFFFLRSFVIFTVKFDDDKIILTGLLKRIVLTKENVQFFRLCWAMKESEKNSMEGSGSSKAPGGGFEAILRDNTRLNISMIVAGYLKSRIITNIGAPVKYEDPREQIKD
jgi:MFS family permease